MEVIKVYDSLNRLLRREESSIYDIIRESVYLLNVACKIEPMYISKELNILIRNLNEDEINHFYIHIKDEIIGAMSMGYEKMSKYLAIYDFAKGECENMFNFFHQIEDIADNSFKIFNYIHARSIYENGCLNKKIKKLKLAEISNMDKFADKIARDICSKLIVVEIKDYSYLYNILKKYYNMSDSLVKISFLTEKFIFNFIKLCNVLFFGTDSHQDDFIFNFKIKPIEEFDFKIMNIVGFFDGYIENNFEDKCVSGRLDKIDSNYIDKYIYKNKENLNNLLFIISKLYTTDDRLYEFNYKEYNLNLISIIEMLLVNSKQNTNINEKFIKNILICLSINNVLLNEVEERKIIREIYIYRSVITHGDYCGYKNSIQKMEKLLKYEEDECDMNRINELECLISKKLNFYVKTIFEVNSKNNTILNLLKK